MQSQDCLRNLEIGICMQFRDSENAQRKLEIAQIPKMRGTYIRLPSTRWLFVIFEEFLTINRGPDVSLVDMVPYHVASNENNIIDMCKARGHGDVHKISSQGISAFYMKFACSKISC